MPTWPGLRVSSGTSPPLRVSWRRISRTVRGAYGPWWGVVGRVAGLVARTTGLAQDVEEAFRTLPARYLGAAPGFDATWHVKLGDLGRVYEVRCTEHGARVRPGTSMRPDVVIGTDAAT